MTDRRTDSGEAGLWPIGSWLSAALDDPSVCAEMKRDINDWFDGSGHLRAHQAGEKVSAPSQGDLGSSAQDADTDRAEDRTVLGWLVERDDLDHRTLYMCEARGGHGWTPDVHTARRFGTKTEASAWCSGGDADGPLKVAEHAWVNL